MATSHIRLRTVAKNPIWNRPLYQEHNRDLKTSQADKYANSGVRYRITKSARSWL